MAEGRLISTAKPFRHDQCHPAGRQGPVAGTGLGSQKCLLEIDIAFIPSAPILTARMPSGVTGILPRHQTTAPLRFSPYFRSVAITSAVRRAIGDFQEFSEVASFLAAGSDWCHSVDNTPAWLPYFLQIGGIRNVSLPAPALPAQPRRIFL